MDDLPVASLYAISLLILIVVLSSALAAEHTNARFPKALLLLAGTIRRTGRRTLIIEIPIVIALLGSELVILMFLLHPQSTIPVRLVAAAELLAAGAWLVYLLGLISRKG